jgi:protein phosphatase
VALIVRYAVRSDLGLVRGNNEDSVYAGPRLLAIADGMGGHAAGEVASKIVISTLESLDDDHSVGDLIAALRESVREANTRISEAVEANAELDGMGTTLTALRFVGSKVGLVHVGDSRAYLLRGDRLTQITHDDTYVQYLVDSGKLTPDEAKDHPRRSVILRTLNGGEVEPDVSIREARAGDRYLLCTDGLTDVVSTETITETLRAPDPQEAADRLVELALRGGGPDNVTVIVADVLLARPGDAVDDVPVVAGAFVDPAAAELPGEDSPAERAATIARPARSEAAEPESPRTRRRWRGAAILLAVLTLLAAGLGGTYAWAQTQYYVGVSGPDVAVYRGVNAAVGPVRFSRVAKRTALKVDDLNPSVQSQVRSGIPANDRGDADRIVRRLQSEQKPLCRPVGTTTSPSASASSTSTTGPSGTRGATPSASRRIAGTAGRTATATRRATRPVIAASSSRPGTQVVRSARTSAPAAATPSAGRSTGPSSTAPASTASPGLSPSTTGTSGDCRRPS